MKTCSKCKSCLPVTEFHRASTKDGRHGHCKACRSRDGAASYARDRAILRRRIDNYLATYAGACSAIWLHIRQRCEGRHRAGKQYSGLPYCSKQEFMAWAELPENREAWDMLRARYLLTGNVADRPSVDRINDDRSIGYMPGNMRWLSHGENARKGNLRRWQTHRQEVRL